MKPGSRLAGWWAFACLALVGCSDPTSASEPPPSPDESTAPAALPQEASSAPDAATSHRVGPWEVEVLSTNRDAGELRGQGNHPADFRQVVTTIQLTNTADAVQDMFMLEYTFGSDAGTQNGYNPWDDWCAPAPQDFNAMPYLFLPGQSRIMDVCVPVNPLDAEGLDMWVWYMDIDDEGVEIEVSLPAQEVEQDIRERDDAETVVARERAASSRQASGLGYRFEIEDVSLASAAGQMQTVRVSLRAEPSGDGLGYPDIAGITPSGDVLQVSVCEDGQYWPVLDGTSWTAELCLDADVADAESLLLVILTPYESHESVTLDASVE